jgi:hypothetical protein
VTALALPLALVLGALASLAGAGIRRLGRRRGRGRRGTALRRLLRSRKERASLLELGGALACFLGAGLAGAAAVGTAPGSGALVYLALLTAAAGGHVAASDATTQLRAERVASGRLAWALAEPAFLLGLGVALLRWRGPDLEAARGAQEVLGLGLSVGPPLAAAGLALAGGALVVAGAARAVPPEEAARGGGRRAGGAVLIGLCRWAAAGATALVIAGLVAGRDLVPLTSEDALLGAAAAAAVALALGIADGLLGLFPRSRRLAGPVAAGLAVAGAVLVVLS